VPAAPVNLYDLTRPELSALLESAGVSPAHTARVWRYLYWECVETIAAMAEVPARVRSTLEAHAVIGVPPVALETDSSDGFTRKYLLRLADGERIETVLMRFTGRVTACVSSQVGCAMGCVFCATGQMGYTRHLTTAEIVAQAVHVQRVLRQLAGTEGHLLTDVAEGTRLRNIVLMGMGEPLHNYDAVMKAVDILTDGTGLALAADRITLSTVGVVPGILRLAHESTKAIHLAVSLHAATQAERAAIVPAARKWPLDELIAACRTYSETTGRRIFYEWTLIEGQNDSPEHTRAVGRLLQGLPAQVNLIPLNPTAGYAGSPTRSTAARQFQSILIDEFDIPSTVRQRRGIDIGAGCGQLAVAG
jgi:23S rRNA (adenine2503-C2)-methyltransferase